MFYFYIVILYLAIGAISFHFFLGLKTIKDNKKDFILYLTLYPFIFIYVVNSFIFDFILNKK